MTTESPSPALKTCALAALAGREEVCTPDECPLWENGTCSLEPLLDSGRSDLDEPDTA